MSEVFIDGVRFVPAAERDEYASALRDLLCATENGLHLLPITWERKVQPLVWRWEAERETTDVANGTPAQQDDPIGAATTVPGDVLIAPTFADTRLTQHRAPVRASR